MAVEVLLASDPDLPAEIAERLSGELPHLLAQRLCGDVDWHVRHVVVAFDGDEQLDVTTLSGALLQTVEGEKFDVAVLITDLPRRAGVRPVAAEVSVPDRLAIVSLPALGALQVYRRTRDAVVRLIGELMCSESGAILAPGPRRHPRLPRVSVEPLDRDSTAPSNVRVVAGPLVGSLRMIAGMLRANRPWRLFLGLSRSLAGVFATAAYAMINSSAWEVGVSLGWTRQALLMLFAVALLVGWLIVDHELWERPRGPQRRRRARLYNLATVLTLAVGVLSLYVELFAGLFLVEQLLLRPGLLRQRLDTPATWSANLAIVWFAASAALIGGALGAGFEDDRVVRRATYGARQRDRQKHRGADRH